MRNLTIYNSKSIRLQSTTLIRSVFADNCVHNYVVAADIPYKPFQLVFVLDIVFSVKVAWLNVIEEI